MGLSSSRPVDSSPGVAANPAAGAAAAEISATAGIGTAASSVATHPNALTDSTETSAARPFYAPVVDLFRAIGNLFSKLIDCLFCRNADDNAEEDFNADSLIDDDSPKDAQPTGTPPRGPAAGAGASNGSSAS